MHSPNLDTSYELDLDDLIFDSSSNTTPKSESPPNEFITPGSGFNENDRMPLRKRLQMQMQQSNPVPIQQSNPVSIQIPKEQNLERCLRCGELIELGQWTRYCCYFQKFPDRKPKNFIL
jgi:hypothetical protein